jgi:hypothetical protein
VLHTHVAKVDQDVAYNAYVASVSDKFCKHLFKIFHLFQTYIASVLICMFYIFYTYIARVFFICFQSYVLASVFMLQVAIVLSGCTTTQNVLSSVSKMASEAGGPVARLDYSR